MKQYPSIPRWSSDLFGEQIVALDKLDGSNVRVEWNKKRGFYKFGTRHHLLDASDPILGGAIDLIKVEEEKLAGVARRERWESAVFFFEFYGPSSFAGSHVVDEQKTVTLIDVNVYKKGHLSIVEMFDLLGESSFPPVLYRGPFDEDLVLKVETNTLPGMTFEGVVCRGAKNADLLFKVKSKDWIGKLRKKCGEDEKLFQRLV